MSVRTGQWGPTTHHWHPPLREEEMVCARLHFFWWGEVFTSRVVTLQHSNSDLPSGFSFLLIVFPSVSIISLLKRGIPVWLAACLMSSPLCFCPLLFIGFLTLFGSQVAFLFSFPISDNFLLPVQDGMTLNSGCAWKVWGGGNGEKRGMQKQVSILLAVEPRRGFE